MQKIKIACTSGITLPLEEIFIVGSTTSLIEALIAVCDTPFLYLARKISKK